MTAGQKSQLRDRLADIEWFKIQFQEDTLWDAMGNMTDDQRRMAHFYANHKKHLKLRNLLLQIGVKPNL